MLSAFSYGIALKLRSEDALAPLLNTVGQPILLRSGILLPWKALVILGVLTAAAVMWAARSFARSVR